jgi:hypothetical protein
MEKVHKIFHWSFKGTFDKRLNDTIIFHIEPQSSNYQVSIRRNDGSLSCSCLYALDPKTETLKLRTLTHSGNAIPIVKDSTVQIKILRFVKDNCLEKNGIAIGKN